MNSIMGWANPATLETSSGHQFGADKGNCPLSHTCHQRCMESLVCMNTHTVSSSPFRASCMLKSGISCSNFHCYISKSIQRRRTSYLIRPIKFIQVPYSSCVIIISETLASSFRNLQGISHSISGVNFQDLRQYAGV